MPVSPPTLTPKAPSTVSPKKPGNKVVGAIVGVVILAIAGIAIYAGYKDLKRSMGDDAPSAASDRGSSAVRAKESEPEPTDIPTLEARLKEAEKRLRYVRRKECVFQVQGRIYERAGGGAMIWGTATGANRGDPGWVMDEANIAIRDCNAGDIATDMFNGSACFIETLSSRDNRGRAVAVKVFGPPPRSFVDAEAAYNRVTEALERARAAAAGVTP